MSAAAHEVDNEGVVNCVKAAKKAGNVKNCFDFEHSHERPSGWVSRFPGVQNYKPLAGSLTKSFVGENYLQNSGIDWSSFDQLG